jgi:hypothetical protein
MRPLLAATLVTMLACDGTLFGVACETIALPGIQVTVRDSVTGAAISDARVIARLGTAADTARFPLDGVYPLAYEKAGTFEVLVQHAAYRTWVRTNVRVTEDECHVKTVPVTALLQRPP